jgi:hypothetical protein
VSDRVYFGVVPSESFGRFHSVTVGAPNFALFYLSQNRRPIPATVNHFAYSQYFATVIHVIEV